MKSFLIATISAIAISSISFAQQPDSVPKLLNYQGKLTNAQGTALQDGTYQVRFTLWDAASDGNLVWGETRPVTLVNGVFHVALGAAGAQPLAGAPVSVIAYAFGSKNRFLETTIVSGPGVAQEKTLAPRQQMVSVPFAFESDSAEEAQNSANLAGQPPSFWVPSGMIVAYGGLTDPPGWLICDGRAVPREGPYAALFASIGTLFGSGDGSSTFNIPNARGMVLRGTGSQTVNGRMKVGPVVGIAQEDQFQGHWHGVWRGLTNSGGTYWGYSSSSTDNQDVNQSGRGPRTNLTAADPVTDQVNGTPRIGQETRVTSLGVNYIIKL